MSLRKSTCRWAAAGNFDTSGVAARVVQKEPGAINNAPISKWIRGFGLFCTISMLADFRRFVHMAFVLMNSPHANQGKTPKNSGDFMTPPSDAAQQNNAWLDLL